MITIEYSKDGDHFSDFEVNDYILECIKKSENIKTSNEFLILVARSLIYEGKINYEDVIFYFEKTPIYSDKYGSLDEYPKGFCDNNEKHLSILCGWNNIDKEEK